MRIQSRTQAYLRPTYVPSMDPPIDGDHLLFDSIGKKCNLGFRHARPKDTDENFLYRYKSLEKNIGVYIIN